MELGDLVADLDNLINQVLEAPTGSLLVVAGILFLLIAVVGNISGKIEPGPKGRVAGGAIGAILLIGGLTIFSNSRLDPAARPPNRAAGATPASAGNFDKGSPPSQAAGAISPAANVDRGALPTSACAFYAEAIFSEDRGKRLQAQVALIANCRHDPAGISAVIGKAAGKMDNRAGIYDALAYLDTVPEGEVHDPALRMKIRDFAVSAARNSADSAVISGRLVSRYR